MAEYPRVHDLAILFAVEKKDKVFQVANKMILILDKYTEEHDLASGFICLKILEWHCQLIRLERRSIVEETSG